MIYIFYFFAAVLVFLGWQSLRGGIFYLEFFKKELAKPFSDYAPFCSIIAPCRGLDENLYENLNALFRQNFPRYEIVFVVDDERDEAVSVIKKLIETHKDFSARLVIAGKSANESRKIHNLRQAVTEVSAESEIFAFVDSDARPSENWLRDLIAPLRDEKIGCTTGYRWFVSEKFGLASELRSIWNASVASALGANLRKNFCWGGSMAIRRDKFENLNVREKWRGTLSDDFALTRLMNEANLPVYFVPQCLTATVEHCNFRQMLEFTTRQMKITRVYSEHLWESVFDRLVYFFNRFLDGRCAFIRSFRRSFLANFDFNFDNFRARRGQIFFANARRRNGFEKIRKTNQTAIYAASDFVDAHAADLFLQLAVRFVFKKNFVARHRIRIEIGN